MGVIKWTGRAWNKVLRKPRADFLEVLPKQSVGAELGVFRGLFTPHILQVVKPTKLHLIDPYWKIYGERFGWSSRDTQDGQLKTKDAYEEAKRAVEEHDKNGVCEFHIEDDLVCLETFDDGYFDWVYVDTSHTYDHTKAELALLDTKVKKDGLITGHDWREIPTHRDHGVYIMRCVRFFCRG